MLGINGNNHTVMAVDADATIEVVNHRHDSSADSVATTTPPRGVVASMRGCRNISADHRN